jgi:hypothetical protein
MAAMLLNYLMVKTLVLRLALYLAAVTKDQSFALIETD